MKSGVGAVFVGASFACVIAQRFIFLPFRLEPNFEVLKAACCLLVNLYCQCNLTASRDRPTFRIDCRQIDVIGVNLELRFTVTVVDAVQRNRNLAVTRQLERSLSISYLEDWSLAEKNTVFVYTRHFARLLTIDKASSQFIGLRESSSSNLDVGTSFAWSTSWLNTVCSYWSK